MWELTETAQAHFPDTHAQLTVDILTTMRAELGQEAVDTVIRARERDSRASYARALTGRHRLVDRVAELARIRSDEGYMAEWTTEEDGSYVLIENHCPICAAASICQEFCRAEINVFREALGPGVRIEREEHILAGARRCAYRIWPDPT
jgi:predicted ArsR family transcriptional regulator